MKKLTFLLIFTTLLNFAQEKTITGKVTNSDGSLPGATVKIVGTKTNVSTGFDGSYSINAKEGDVLEASYVGAASKTLTVAKSNVINFNLTMGVSGFSGWNESDKKKINKNPLANFVLNETKVSSEIKDAIESENISKVKYIKPKKQF